MNALWCIIFVVIFERCYSLSTICRISYHYVLKVFHNKLEKHSESIDLCQAPHFAHATNLVPVQVGRAGIPEFELPFFEVGELKNNYTFLPVPGL